MSGLHVTLETLTACPICGGEVLFPCRKALHYGVEIHYSRCAACETIFLNPRITDADTETYYRGAYRDLLGVGDKNDLRSQAKRAQDQAALLRGYLKDVHTNLEIGCSAGYLMRELKRLGVYSTGVEPDTRYHAIPPASRFQVYASLDGVENLRFDLISMSHVLEHINHPLDYMRDLLDKHARLETRVFIEVPNAAASGIAYLIHHPIAFTQETLTGLFARLGWKPVFMRLSGGKTKHNREILALFVREG